MEDNVAGMFGLVSRGLTKYICYTEARDTFVTLTSERLAH